MVLRHIYLYRGSPVRLLPMVAWVAIDIVLWGFITRYLNSVTGPRFNFVPAILGAVLLWDFLTRVMQGVTTAFFEDVWSRNFLNFFATPLKVSEYLCGLVVTGVCTSLVGLMVMLLLATSVFGLSFFAFGLALIPFVMVLFLSGIALGIFGASIVLRLGPASEWLIWPIPSMLSPFVGVFYPSVGPARLDAGDQPVPRLPLMYSRACGPWWPARTRHIACWAQAAVLAVVYLLLAGATFTLVYRHAIRTGLIARYSAESAG